jgi:drug/metabolite transporter (DMT)-like permease
LSRRLGAELSLFLVALFWAANYSLIQYILREIPVIVFVTLRFAIIAAAGWAAVALYRQPARWRREDLPLLAAIGILGGGVYQYLFVLGLSRTTSFSSALLNTTAPLLSLAILALLRIEPVRPWHWAGYALAFAGIAVFLVESRRGPAQLEGNLLSLAAALCWAIYGILAKKVSHRYSALTMGAWTYTVCFASIAAYGGAATLVFPLARIRPLVWIAVAASGIFAVTIGWIVWVHGIRVLGVAGTVKFSFVVPVAAGIFAVIFQGERFTAVKLAGAAAVLLGLLLARVPGWRTPPLEPRERAS